MVNIPKIIIAGLVFIFIAVVVFVAIKIIMTILGVMFSSIWNFIVVGGVVSLIAYLVLNKLHIIR